MFFYRNCFNNALKLLKLRFKDTSLINERIARCKTKMELYNLGYDVFLGVSPGIFPLIEGDRTIVVLCLLCPKINLDDSKKIFKYHVNEIKIMLDKQIFCESTFNVIKPPQTVSNTNEVIQINHGGGVRSLLGFLSGNPWPYAGEIIEEKMLGIWVHTQTSCFNRAPSYAVKRLVRFDFPGEFKANISLKHLLQVNHNSYEAALSQNNVKFLNGISLTFFKHADLHKLPLLSSKKCSLIQLKCDVQTNLYTTLMQGFLLRNQYFDLTNFVPKELIKSTQKFKEPNPENLQFASQNILFAETSIGKRMMENKTHSNITIKTFKPQC